LYAAGILLADFFRLPPLPLLAGGLGLAIISLAWGRARPLVLWPLVLVTGSADLALRRAVISPQDFRNLLGVEPQIATVRGRVHETPQLRVYAHGEQESWRTLAQVDVTAIRLDKLQNWRPAFGRMAITTRGTLTNFFAGQIVEVTGVARLPR